MAPQRSPADYPDPGKLAPVRGYRALPAHRRRRVDAIRGGAAGGCGLGLALAWTLGIFQRANPQSYVTNAAGNTAPAYPPMALTVFVVVIIAGLAIGLGIGNMVAALIPEAPPQPEHSAAAPPGQDASSAPDL
jgi:hypothetical protein